MDSPTLPLWQDTAQSAAPLSAVERFAALIDALCAALLAELAPRTWLGAVFGGISRRLTKRMCADLREMSDALRALAAGLDTGKAIDVADARDVRTVEAHDGLPSFPGSFTVVSGPASSAAGGVRGYATGDSGASPIPADGLGDPRRRNAFGGDELPRSSGQLAVELDDVVIDPSPRSWGAGHDATQIGATTRRVSAHRLPLAAIAYPADGCGRIPNERSTIGIFRYNPLHCLRLPI